MIKTGGILLAGGKSSRMGRDKGSLDVDGQPLYRYALEVLEGLCQELIISTGSPERFPIQYQKVSDEVSNIGPIGGIYSCLKASGQEWNLVLSYDMPLVTTGLFNYLLEQRGSGKEEQNAVILPAGPEGRPEPLCGIYHRSSLDTLGHMIDEGTYAVHRILERCQGKVVEIRKDLPFYHEGLFMNINTQEDLEKLLPEIRRKKDA